MLAKLKTAFTSAPVLGFPREEGQWYLGMDTSEVGTGAVLSQMQNSQEPEIAYASKSPEDCERRYCSAGKELLAVI